MPAEAVVAEPAYVQEHFIWGNGSGDAECEVPKHKNTEVYHQPPKPASLAIQGSSVARKNCSISEEYLEKITTFKKITNLEFIACQFGGSLIAKTLVTLVNNGLEKLALSGSEISEKHLLYIAENIQEKNKLKHIDLSHIALCETGAKAVNEIMSKAHCLENINLHDCELDVASLGILCQKEKVPTSPLKSLILSSNPDMWDDVKMVTDLVDKFGSKEIDISANYLGSAHISELASVGVKTEVRKLYVCENPINNWKSLGNLVKSWRIREVDASECRMYREDCHDFASSLGSYKLDELNLHHPDRSKKFADETRELLKNTASCLKI